MARSIVSPQSKIPKKVFSYTFNRSLKKSGATTTTTTSTTSSAVSTTITKIPSPIRPPVKPTVDVADPRALFGSITTSELLRAAANLHAAAVGPVVDVGMWVMKSKLMEVEAVRGLVLGTVKHTFYQHFCAGEDDAAVEKTVRRLQDVGLRSMLDYALEYANDEESCDRNLEGFLRTIESTRALPSGSVSIWISFYYISPYKFWKYICYSLFFNKIK